MSSLCSFFKLTFWSSWASSRSSSSDYSTSWASPSYSSYSSSSSSSSCSCYFYNCFIYALDSFRVSAELCKWVSSSRSGASNSSLRYWTMLYFFGILIVLVSSSRSGKSRYLSPGESPSLSRSSFCSYSANSYSFYYFFFNFLLSLFYFFDLLSVFWTKPWGSSALASVFFFSWARSFVLLVWLDLFEWFPCPWCLLKL